LSAAPRGNTGSVPYDLLREASRRFRILAVAVAALWAVGITLDHITGPATVRALSLMPEPSGLVAANSLNFRSAS